MKTIEITKKKLKYLYDTKTQIEIKKILGICNSTLYKMLDEANIPRKKERGENIKYKIID